MKLRGQVKTCPYKNVVMCNVMIPALQKGVIGNLVIAAPTKGVMGNFFQSSLYL